MSRLRIRAGRVLEQTCPCSLQPGAPPCARHLQGFPTQNGPLEGGTLRQGTHKANDQSGSDALEDAREKSECS